MKTLKRKMLGAFWLAALSIVTAFNPANASGGGKVTLRAEVERGVLPADTRQNALIKITVNAPDMPVEKGVRSHRMNLSVVLDKSGSMSGQKIEKAKEAAITALRMLRPDDVFSLIVYDTSARIVVAAAPVNNYSSIEEMIRSVRSNGSTALFAGVSLGANEIRKNLREGFVNRIILLSDGQANIGPSSPDQLGRLGASLMKEGISVSTVGVGSDYNEDLMTSLSQNSDGNFYFVENSNDLPMIFAKELGSALKVAAQGLEIRIICPDGVKPQGILGHDCKINGNSIDLSFNQVYGGHAKSLILQVEVPPESPEKILKLATVEMSYKDASGSRYSISENVEASFSRDREKVRKSSNAAVLDESAIQQNAVLKKQAVEEADKGSFTKAKELLQKGAELLYSRSKLTGNKAMEDAAEKSELQAKKMDSNKPIDNEERKKMKGETYQILNSQPYKQ
ncbi:MAG: hypothetical protein A2017_11420 [Lentisphaerae bacterium GWF2_44_16]|nr:MAG: hypothetical protein A2017_11420 [Lentisphaerae bacterium GWF2_44_16]